MFAVKGWSVDPAALKPQTEIFKSSKGDGETLKSSKKRKRGRGREDGKSNDEQSEDVSRLWERHVEGRQPPSKRRKNKEPKREKLGEPRELAALPQDGTDLSKQAVQGELRNGTGDVTKKRKKNKKQTVERSGEQGHSTVVKEVPREPQKATSSTGSLTLMQSAMRQKLVSARFRHLNQALYTKASTVAQQLFDDNPEMFEDYHAGFRQQVSVWPENPIDKFIDEIRARGKVRAPKKDSKGRHRRFNRGPEQDGSFEALPRTHGTCIIADLGCGDARLAETLQKSGDNTQLNLKLYSYDLHSQSPLVTKADISNLPQQDGSVDIAIFCLALMGTNWISFIEEAYRVLHWKGELWIAEIKSRFGRVGKYGKVVEHSVGNKRKQAAIKSAKEAKKRAEDEMDEQDVLQTVVDGVLTGKQETDVSAFVDILKRRGFILKSTGGGGVDLSNKMFVKMEFIKAATPSKGKGVPIETAPGLKKAKTKFIPELEDEVTTEDEAGTLKPCLYKIR